MIVFLSCMQLVISIAFDQFRLPVALILCKHLQTLPHDLAVLPLRSDTLAGLQLHAAVPLHPPLHEVTLVGLDLSLKHGDAALPLDEIVSPASAIDDVAVYNQRSVALTSALMKFALVSDAFLVLAGASALFESLQHLAPEAHFPQFAIGHHIQQRGSGHSPILDGGIRLLCGGSRGATLLLVAFQALLQAVFLKLELHDHLLEGGDLVEQGGHCIGHGISL